jgi:hypothetical protein
LVALCLLTDIVDSQLGHFISVKNSWPNIKEHATLSAVASVDDGVGSGTTENHVEWAADRGCCVPTCCRFLVHRHWRQPKRNALVYNEIKASKSCFFP